jgi:hypothetical protein
MVPASQSVQLLCPSDPWNLPAAQAEQAWVPSEKNPAGQTVQVALPATL